RQRNWTWTGSLANGTHTVKINVGHAQYASNNTLNVNGVDYWTNLALGIKQFANQTQTLTVTNGKIVLDNTGAPDRMTKLNYIEITPALNGLVSLPVLEAPLTLDPRGLPRASIGALYVHI